MRNPARLLSVVFLRVLCEVFDTKSLSCAVQDSVLLFSPSAFHYITSAAFLFFDNSIMRAGLCFCLLFWSSDEDIWSELTFVSNSSLDKYDTVIMARGVHQQQLRY